MKLLLLACIILIVGCSTSNERAITASPTQQQITGNTPAPILKIEEKAPTIELTEICGDKKVKGIEECDPPGKACSGIDKGMSFRGLCENDCMCRPHTAIKGGETN